MQARLDDGNAMLCVPDDVFKSRFIPEIAWKIFNTFRGEYVLGLVNAFVTYAFFCVGVC